MDDDALVRRQDEPRLGREVPAVDGDVERSARVPGGELLSRTDVEDRPPPPPLSGSSGAGEPTNGPRLSSTIRSMFAGRTPVLIASATNSSSSVVCSLWLNRRSKPIVEDAFELMPAPHSEPETWPG